LYLGFLECQGKDKIKCLDKDLVLSMLFWGALRSRNNDYL